MVYQALYESVKEVGYKLSNTILQNYGNNQPNWPLFWIGVISTVASIAALGYTIHYLRKHKKSLF